MYIPLLDFMVKCAVHWHKYTEIVWNCLVYINRLEATLVIRVVYLMAKRPSVVTKAFPSRLNWSRNRWKIPILAEFVLNGCFNHHLEYGGIWFWIKKIIGGSSIDFMEVEAVGLRKGCYDKKELSWLFLGPAKMETRCYSASGSWGKQTKRLSGGFEKNKFECENSGEMDPKSSKEISNNDLKCARPNMAQRKVSEKEAFCAPQRLKCVEGGFAWGVVPHW